MPRLPTRLYVSFQTFLYPSSKSFYTNKIPVRFAFISVYFVEFHLDDILFIFCCTVMGVGIIYVKYSAKSGTDTMYRKLPKYLETHKLAVTCIIRKFK